MEENNKDAFRDARQAFLQGLKIRWSEGMIP